MPQCFTQIKQRVQSRVHPMVLIIATYGLYYMGMTACSSFLTIFVQNAGGYDASFVSKLMLGTSLVSLLTQPLIGYLTDTYIPIKKLSIAFMLLAIPAGYLIPMTLSIPWLLMVSYLLTCFFDNSMFSLLDTWVNQVKERDSRVVYSVARGMGSFSSAIIAKIVGVCMISLGNSVIFTFHAVFLLLGAIAACFVLDVPCGNKRTTHSEKSDSLSMAAAGKLLIKNKKYLYMLLAMPLVSLGYNVSTTYMAVMLLDMGGTSGSQGSAVFWMLILVWPVMLVYPWLYKKLGANKTMLLACVFLLLRPITMAAANTLSVMIICQVVYSFAFGLFNPIALDYTASITPARLRATAISLSGTIQMAVCGLIGNSLAGVFIAFSSLRVFLWVLSLVCVAGIFMMILSIKTPTQPEVLAERQEIENRLKSQTAPQA